MIIQESPLLLLGDCLEKMSEIPDGSIDMVMTDPPYGTTACKWDSIIPLEPMWEHLKRVIKPNGAIVMMASQPFTTTLIASNMKMFKYCWIWEKERPTNIFGMKHRPGKVHEDIVVFYSKQPVYNPITEPSKQPRNNDRRRNKSQRGAMNTIETLGTTKAKISSSYDPTRRQPRSVLKISRGTRGKKRLHPTQKPVALMEYLIKTYTQEGETILDFCMGSGTTGVACKNLDRRFVGIEKDETYFEIAKARIEGWVPEIKKDEVGMLLLW